MNLFICEKISIFGVEKYDLGTYFNYFRTYSIKTFYEKKRKEKYMNQNFSSFWPIYHFELNGKRSQAKPSQAENLSARNMA